MPQHKSDGKELHDFTRIVLIWAHDQTTAGVVGSTVSHTGEVNTHHGIHRHLLEQGSIIAKRSCC